MKKAIVPLGIIVLLIFGVFMYVNRFTLFHTVEVEGIVFDSTDLTTNLTGGVTKESNKITYKNIKIIGASKNVKLSIQLGIEGALITRTV